MCTYNWGGRHSDGREKAEGTPTSKHLNMLSALKQVAMGAQPRCTQRWDSGFPVCGAGRLEAGAGWLGRKNFPLGEVGRLQEGQAGDPQR